MKVRIRIERLVLEGVAEGDADRLRAAIEHALAERLRHDPALRARARNGALRLAGGRFAVPADASAETLGERIAAQLAAATSP